MCGRDVVSASARERTKERGTARGGVRCQFVLFVYFIFFWEFDLRANKVRGKALGSMGLNVSHFR